MLSLLRGCKPKISDQQVLAGITIEIKNNKFINEGSRKVKKRMKRNIDSPIVAGSARFNRIMRENKLLSPYRIERKIEMPR